MRWIVIDNNPQVIANLSKRQFCLCNISTKFNFIGSLIIGYGINTVIKVPNIGIVARTSFQTVMSSSARKDVIAVSTIQCVIAAVTINDVIIISAGNSL